MKQERYRGPRARDVDDTGFEVGPVEVETELVEYDFRKNDLKEGTTASELATDLPVPPVSSAVIATSPDSGLTQPPPPKKPVARANAPRKTKTDSADSEASHEKNKGQRAKAKKAKPAVRKTSSSTEKPAQKSTRKKAAPAKRAPVKVAKKTVEKKRARTKAAKQTASKERSKSPRKPSRGRDSK